MVYSHQCHYTKLDILPKMNASIYYTQIGDALEEKVDSVMKADICILSNYTFKRTIPKTSKSDNHSKI